VCGELIQQLFNAKIKEQNQETKLSSVGNISRIFTLDTFSNPDGRIHLFGELNGKNRFVRINEHPKIRKKERRNTSTSSQRHFIISLLTLRRIVEKIKLFEFS